ncbi:ferrochelatase [Candidatus Viridilinea mediisalina]|uniref:Ferrochelatase n=1 Tax=Candidatus Viridilinea mediisalina TaxID=2024553 RepID=A0A2A6RPK2_9CHLR|nr:ferrochelatase [Candidatus Viridilinea mediisalina]PDW04790.1 ferrochelatase [Candidatus Viridilinea mediisalina]
MTNPIGLLVMEYGEPQELGEVADYLTAHYGGYTPPPEDIAALQARCQQVWGTERGGSAAGLLANALSQVLAERSGDRFRVALGARHWTPTVTSALQELCASGAQTVVVLPLSPHASLMGLRDYERTLERAQAELQQPCTIHLIKDWPDLPGYWSAITRHTRAALAQLEAPAEAVALLCMAHSVAESSRKPETNYQQQLTQRTAQLTSELGCGAGRLAYYGAEGPGQWLGPEVGSALEELAQAGYRHVLAVGISSTYDNVEICYELDGRLAQLAATLGVGYARAALPNADPELVAGLADLVDGTVVERK